LLDALDTLEAPARPPGVGTRPCANEAPMFFLFSEFFFFLGTRLCVNDAFRSTDAGAASVGAHH